MDRVKLTEEILGVSKARALVNLKMIEKLKLPDDKLLDFFAFRMNYANEKMSVEMITKKAVFEYSKKMIEDRLRAGQKVFKTMEQLKEFLITYYKGKNVCNCGEGSGWFGCVVIGIDEKENFVNKYAKTDYDTYLKLPIDEEARFLKWLLENQYKIGDINYDEILEGKKALEKALNNVKEIEIKKDDYKEKEIKDERIKKLLVNFAKKQRR